MYLKNLKITGIKCFDELTVDLPHTANDYGGWVVLLGGNGVGKSTLLQAMALTLMGPLSGQRLVRPEGWVREGEDYGIIEAELVRGDWDSEVGQPRKKPYHVKFAVIGKQEVELEGQPYDQPQLVHLADDRDRKALFSGPYAAKRAGWFSCGYGPFRRLSGGDSRGRSLPEREVRFLTLFSESTALTQCEDWLTNLYSRSIDEFNTNKDRDKADLATIRRVIDLLLPGTVEIDRIDSQHVYFRTAGQTVVAIPELSDGYRSFLALAIDLMRHLTESGLSLQEVVQLESGDPRIQMDGVVLVDEIDSHLHPIWQCAIGFRLCKVFPRIQFIVTSHSPFVAQAATDRGLFVLRQQATNGLVDVAQSVASVRGWRVDQILTSDLFGLTETRDIETQQLLDRHAELVKRRTWADLTAGEQRELAQLEEQMSTRLTAPGESVREREKQIEMAQYVERTLEKLESER